MARDVLILLPHMPALVMWRQWYRLLVIKWQHSSFFATFKCQIFANSAGSRAKNARVCILYSIPTDRDLDASSFRLPFNSVYMCVRACVRVCVTTAGVIFSAHNPKFIALAQPPILAYSSAFFWQKAASTVSLLLPLSSITILSHYASFVATAPVILSSY